MSLHYEGWIRASAEDKKFLEEMGIEVGEYNFKKNRFEDCVVPASAHAQLTMLIGRFEVNLEAVKTEEAEEE